jgi:DNA replication and repair protein RecF
VQTLELELINWRLFEDKKLILDKQNTLIYGDNGSGKTTLLSALYGLYTGEAWPGTVWRQQIKTNENYFGIKASDVPDWYVSGLISPQGRVITRYSDEIPHDWSYTVISYLPDENRWLTLSRTAKLALLDRALVSVYGKVYSEALKKLDKAVLTKGRIIKQYYDTGEEDLILVQELHEMIVQTSGALWKYRQEFLQQLSDKLSGFGAWIESELIKTHLRWMISHGTHKVAGFETSLFPSWQIVWAKEKQVGRVFYGAQRDDFGFEFNDQPAENFLSRGENRAFVIYFKQFVRSLLSNKVLWLLDDFFNEFDSKREVSVLEQLVQEGDWIVATATRKVDGFQEYIKL